MYGLLLHQTTRKMLHVIEINKFLVHYTNTILLFGLKNLKGFENERSIYLSTSDTLFTLHVLLLLLNLKCVLFLHPILPSCCEFNALTKVFIHSSSTIYAPQSRFNTSTFLTFSIYTRSRNISSFSMLNFKKKNRY